ncbi:MAG: hypothetical protein JRH07_19635, partial [Deltaproteobacteria bacterium]|nr:hypothetical protein [Deltaproteobacteria bacterium]
DIVIYKCTGEVFQIGFHPRRVQRQGVIRRQSDMLGLDRISTKVFGHLEGIAQRESIPDDHATDQPNPLLGEQVGEIAGDAVIAIPAVPILAEKVVSFFVAVDGHDDREEVLVHEIGFLTVEEGTIGRDVKPSQGASLASLLLGTSNDFSNYAEVEERLAAIEVITVAEKAWEKGMDPVTSLLAVCDVILPIGFSS